MGNRLTPARAIVPGRMSTLPTIPSTGDLMVALSSSMRALHDRGLRFLDVRLLRLSEAKPRPAPPFSARFEARQIDLH